MVQWPGINNRGMVVGISETAETDPLGESWSCEAFLGESDQSCRGFFYNGGALQAMPTLGGTHSFATGVNNLGQVVGWAETDVHDPTCREAQVLQFRAVLWDPQRGSLQELPPFPGDSASAATAINQRGQVVGISGECDVAVGRFSAQHAVMWDHGRVIEVGDLGGTTWHTPMDINERGDVVGFSNPPGAGDPDGDFIAQAFLWNQRDGTTPLGTLDGDLFSQAHAINDQGVVVGVSFGGSSGSRAFLWMNGVMHDFNDLVGNFPGVFQSAQDINDQGQVTGRVRLDATGEVVTFVATPVIAE
jgi:probable HAF family extracellular repeat protein